MESNQKEILKLKRRMNAFFGLFIISICFGFLSFFSINPIKLVSALSNNYSKGDGSQLTKEDWNNLPSDFVDQSGDAMSGPLTIGGGNYGLRLKAKAGDINFWSLYAHENYGDLNFWYDNVDKLTIKKDSGNVGIGIGNPSAKLEVNGIIKANDPVDNNDVVTKNYLNKFKIASGQNVSALPRNSSAFTASYPGRDGVMPYKEIDLSSYGFDCSKSSFIIVSHNYVAGAEKPSQAIDTVKCKYIVNSSDKCKFLVECGGSTTSSGDWFASIFDWQAIQLP